MKTIHIKLRIPVSIKMFRRNFTNIRILSLLGKCCQSGYEIFFPNFPRYFSNLTASPSNVQSGIHYNIYVRIPLPG